MFFELLDTLETALAQTAKEIGLNERERASKAYGQVLVSLYSIGIREDHLVKMPINSRKEYLQVKRRVLSYLLYYHWLVRYIGDPHATMEWRLDDLFEYAKQDDWIQSAIEAKKMMLRKKAKA